jgi:Protein of unknown function (DUF2934)
MMTASPERRKRRSQSTQQKEQEPVPPPTGGEVAQEPTHYCQDLHDRIGQRAYELYVERGCREGCSLEDWLDAEREITSREQSV